MQEQEINNQIVSAAKKHQEKNGGFYKDFVAGAYFIINKLNRLEDLCKKWGEKNVELQKELQKYKDLYYQETTRADILQDQINKHERN